MTNKPRPFLSAGLSGTRGTRQPPAFWEAPQRLDSMYQSGGREESPQKRADPVGWLLPWDLFPGVWEVADFSHSRVKRQPWSETAPRWARSTAVNLQADYLRELTFCVAILKQICLLPINQQSCSQLQALCRAGWRRACLGGTEWEKRGILTPSTYCSHDPAWTVYSFPVPWPQAPSIL